MKFDSVKRVAGIVTLIADRTTRRAAHVTGDRSAFFAALKAVHADPTAMRTIHFRNSFSRGIALVFIQKRARGKGSSGSRGSFVALYRRANGHDDPDGHDEPDQPEEEPLVEFLLALIFPGRIGLLDPLAAARAVLAGASEQNEAEEPAEDLTDPTEHPLAAPQTGEFLSAHRTSLVEHDRLPAVCVLRPDPMIGV